jgi:hypothetical protein
MRDAESALREDELLDPRLAQDDMLLFNASRMIGQRRNES